MDDDYDGGSYGSGLSGWAWHELGRQSERSSQNTIRTAAVVGARLRGDRQVNVHALHDEVQLLREHNRALIQRVNDLHAEIHSRHLDFQKLDAWADKIYAELISERKLRQQVEAASPTL